MAEFLDLAEEYGRRVGIIPPKVPRTRLAHLVLASQWPKAPCGHNVNDFLGTRAPAMDRCTGCLRIAEERKLGRPGLDKKPTT